MDVTPQFLKLACNSLTSRRPGLLILSLTPSAQICEIIFNLMLRGYSLSLEAYYNHSVKNSAKEGKPRQSLDKWEQVMSSAHQALEMFRDAGG